MLTFTTSFKCSVELECVLMAQLIGSLSSVEIGHFKLMWMKGNGSLR